MLGKCTIQYFLAGSLAIYLIFIELIIKSSAYPNMKMPLDARCPKPGYLTMSDTDDQLMRCSDHCTKEIVNETTTWLGLPNCEVCCETKDDDGKQRPDRPIVTCSDLMSDPLVISLLVIIVLLSSVSIGTIIWSCRLRRQLKNRVSLKNDTTVPCLQESNSSLGSSDPCETSVMCF